ncbi:DUF6894 family protein [Methylobacterium crusticola]|uniref:DUF6894 family protein n=1 Tax=Methylobacterium crusticola TaxID=1697972 RepID=UPI000FFB97B0|nr:hypothetical protein [Methylobacterium crusticola]
MPRFFFSLVSGSGEPQDLDGQEFASTSEACAEAHRIAADAMDTSEIVSPDWVGWAVEVQDAAGGSAMWVPFVQRKQ